MANDEDPQQRTASTHSYISSRDGLHNMDIDVIHGEIDDEIASFVANETLQRNSYPL